MVMQVSLFLSISWLGIGVLWLPIVAICSDQSSSPSEAEHAAAAVGSTSNAPVSQLAAVGQVHIANVQLYSPQRLWRDASIQERSACRGICCINVTCARR